MSSTITLKNTMARSTDAVQSVSVYSLLVLALLAGCSGADAGQEPGAGRLQAQQEQRRAVAAAQACGPGMTALWHDTTTMQCMREIPP